MLILIVNTICFSLIFLMGTNWPDGMLIIQCTILLAGLGVLLFQRGKKYISRKDILVSICLFILQPVTVIALERAGLWHVGSGHPLSGSGFGVLFYFLALILFNILLLLTNIIKWAYNILKIRRIR